MVITPRIRIDRDSYRRTQYWLSSVRSKRRYVSQEVLDEGQDIIYDQTQRHTPRGKSSKLVDGWKKGGARTNRTVYNEVPYLRAVDEGTKPHDIPAKPGKALRLPREYPRRAPRKGQTRYFSVVHHPGSKARRFINKIYRSARPKVLELFEKKVDAMLS